MPSGRDGVQAHNLPNWLDTSQMFSSNSSSSAEDVGEKAQK